MNKYRLLISKRYLFFCGIHAIIILFGCFVFLYYNGVFLLKVMAIQMAWFSLVFIWYLIQHRLTLMKIIDGMARVDVELIETYINGQKRDWEDLLMIRLILGCLIALGFLFTLIFVDATTLSQILGGLFLSYIITMIMKAWLDFHDHILLQDIRHSLKDYSS